MGCVTLVMRGAAWAERVGAYPVTSIAAKPHQPQSLGDCPAERSANFPVSNIQDHKGVTLALRCGG